MPRRVRRVPVHVRAGRGDRGSELRAVDVVSVARPDARAVDGVSVDGEADAVAVVPRRVARVVLAGDGRPFARV